MNILLGLSGSIATYRSPDLVKALVEQGHNVRIALTSSASHFVGIKALETFCGSKPYSHDHFDDSHLGTDHISAARWAHLFLFYGTTANTLAKMANGFANDFLGAQYLAFEGPVIISAAMNPQMWKHPAVQNNVQKLSSFGAEFVGPVHGKVACGEVGVGHIAPISEILDAVERHSKKL